MGVEELYGVTKQNTREGKNTEIFYEVRVEHIKDGVMILISKEVPCDQGK